MTRTAGPAAHTAGVVAHAAGVVVHTYMTDDVQTVLVVHTAGIDGTHSGTHDAVCDVSY